MPYNGEEAAGFPSRSPRAEEVLEEYLGLLRELGEPSVGEVEEAAREELWRKLERLRGAPEASS